MRRVHRVLPASLRRRPRLVIAASLAVAVASSAGIVTVGALLAEHDTAWRGYQAAQTQLTAAEQSRDAAAAGLEQARTAALAAFTTARTLHDESTAHGVLLTAASEVARLGSELAAVTTTTGITVDSSGAASVAPSGFSLTASASSALDDRSGTSALGSATAALTAEIGSAQAATTELTAKTQAVTAATATLQTTATAAANAEHVPVTGEPAGADPHCAAVPGGTRTVFVSIADQHLWACDGTQLRLDTAVTTGATAITNVDDSTPTGTFHVQGKAQNTVLRGSDANGSWNDPVTYWIPFMDGVGLHDASWQTFPYGSAQYTTEGSHACVHTPVAQLAVLYSWLRIGDRVVIS